MIMKWGEELFRKLIKKTVLIPQRCYNYRKEITLEPLLDFGTNRLYKTIIDLHYDTILEKK